MQVHIAHTSAQRALIRELRLRVNLEELKKVYLPENDEEQDLKSTLLFIEDKGQMIASLRCQFTFPAGQVLSKWGISFAGKHPKIAIVDRLVVLPEYRGGRAAYLLMLAIYRQALVEDAKLAFLECESHLLGLYKKFGFQAYREVDYSYGTRYQHFINPWDWPGLERAGSPFKIAYNAYMEEVNAFIRLSESTIRA